MKILVGILFLVFWVLGIITHGEVGIIFILISTIFGIFSGHFLGKFLAENWCGDKK